MIHQMNYNFVQTNGKIKLPMCKLPQQRPINFYQKILGKFIKNSLKIFRIFLNFFFEENSEKILTITAKIGRAPIIFPDLILFG